MKSIFAVFIVTVFAFGCAQLGPYAISPSVYNSSADSISAHNKAREEEGVTEQLNQKQIRERSQARQKIVLGQMTPSHDATVDLSGQDANGVFGGFPVIIENNTNRRQSVNITKLSGIQKGQQWTFELMPRRHKLGNYYREYHLEAGRYAIRWYNDYGSLHPKRGPDYFEVATYDKYFSDLSGKSYCGGYTILQ